MQNIDSAGGDVKHDTISRCCSSHSFKGITDHGSTVDDAAAVLAVAAAQDTLHSEPVDSNAAEACVLQINILPSQYDPEMFLLTTIPP